MAVSGVSDDRNYTSWLNGGSSTNATGSYNAVIKTDGEEGVSTDDFFQLMIAQLTNQDFMNPAGDTEYMSQMAQFYAMQSMQEVASLSRQNLAVSMVGKTVTASKYNIGGSVNTQTGEVEKIVQKDGEYQFFVNGTAYTISQITEVHGKDVVPEGDQPEGTDKPDTPEGTDTGEGITS